VEASDGIAGAVRRVSASVRGIAGNEAQDVVQEAVARALKSGVSPESEAWLRTVARRVAIDRKRRSREYASGAPADLERYTRSNDGDPEDAIIRAERAAELRQALSKLPPRYRKVLVAYAEEDSPADVAKRLGMSASATWTLLSRARSRLRLQLEQIGFVPVTILGQSRWRAILAGGAAAGVAVAMALHPSLPRSHGPELSTAPKVAQATAGAGAPKTNTVTSGVLPEVALPDPDVALPELPAAPAAPVETPAVKACIETPRLGGLIPAVGLIVVPDPGLSDRVLGLLPPGVHDAGTHLCGK
jgi:RNA polymerase sigma factor (sigma-70 family)